MRSQGIQRVTFIPPVELVPLRGARTGNHLKTHETLTYTMAWVEDHVESAKTAFQVSFYAAFFVAVLAGCVVIGIGTGTLDNLPPKLQMDAKASSCLRVTRKADYTVVLLSAGSPLQQYELLFRPETVMDYANFQSTAHPVSLFSMSMLKSKTLYCDGSSCIDRMLLYKQQSTNEQAYVWGRFKFENLYEENDQDEIAVQLGLDGSLALATGYSYTLSASFLCFQPTGSSPPAEGPSLSLTTYHMDGEMDGKRHLVARRGDLADFPRTKSSPVAQSLTNNCQNVSTRDEWVGVFPDEGYMEHRRWLSLLSNARTEYTVETLENRRRVLEVGKVCAETDPLLTVSNTHYRLSCYLHYSACKEGLYLPWRRVASNYVRFELKSANDPVLMYASEAQALSELPALVGYEASVNTAIGRLFIMILTAALTYMRGSQPASKTGYMLTHALKTVLNVLPSKYVLGTSAWDKWTDLLITGLALVSRVLVLGFSFLSMVKDNLLLVVICETLAAVCSAFQMFMRHVLLKSEPGKEPALTKLGGTNAIVDVTLAVLLSFTTPPILSTQNQNFDGIGRLLISLLISLSVVPKCAFAVAGNFLMGFSVTNVNSRGKDWKPRLYRFYLWLAAALWLVQLTTTVITVASLVVIPASFSISRALVGHSTLMQFTLLFGLLCVGAPTLCKTARRTCAEICAMKHASEVDKSS